MEAAAATRSVHLPMMTTAQPSRKEWRIVSEHSARNNDDNEDLMRSKLGQSNERTTFEVHQGREPADVDFCSITIDGHPDGDILQQQFRKATRQREELQHMEIELRAQIFARADVAEMQNSFDAHLKDQANSNVKLQEKVFEMEQTIHGLERKMEEKERELRAIKLDNEAAWAKEDLLIEQSNELKIFRREHDNTEAERTQHLKQIHDLQEHLQDKERQFLELQEQNRVVHETILFKDEQLKDAQSWIARVQEMDVFQSTTHQSLQAELRERTDQYNQLCLAYQQQFAEMERIHLLTIQQHQLEIADARDRAGFYSDETHLPKDSSQVGQSNGSQMNVNGSTKHTNSGTLSNGNAESISSENLRNEVDNAHGIAISPSSLVGMPTYLSPGQIAAFHPFLVHQQSVHSVPPHVAQSHFANFHSFPAASSLQHWPNQQVVTEVSPDDQEYPSSQNGHNILESDTIYSVNGPATGLVTLVDHSCEVPEHISVTKSSAEVQPADMAHLVSPQPQQSIQQVPSQFDSSLRLNSLPGYEPKIKETEKASYSASEPSAADCASSTTSEPLPPYEATRNLLSLDEMGRKATGAAVPSEVPLLDERSLLACIARTIPPGSGSTIRISSTLPNRLGKMLAPLHWHDYKKKYGKLEDFVSSHAELFAIEGDYIQVREGAKEIIAAAAAIAKVVAATNKTLLTPNSSPSVAVTPMSQSHRTTKRTVPPSINMNVNTSTYGGYFNAGGVVPKVKILSKPIDSRVMKTTEISNPLSKGQQQQAHGGRPEARTVGAATTFRKW